MEFEAVARVIEENRGDAVDFGNPSCDFIPTDARIQETERLIGHKLPASYVWFLKNYGGGTIFGDDIFAVEAQYSGVNMVDVATRTLSDRQNGFVKDSEISICFTDFGEQFLLDASDEAAATEYPVIRKTGDMRKVVAESFADFLVKFIQEEIT